MLEEADELLKAISRLMPYIADIKIDPPDEVRILLKDRTYSLKEVLMLLSDLPHHGEDEFEVLEDNYLRWWWD